MSVMGRPDAAAVADLGQHAQAGTDAVAQRSVGAQVSGESLVMPLAVRAGWGLNWQPLSYTHPRWLSRLGIDASALGEVGSRQWQLSNLLLLNALQLSALQGQTIGQLPVWWQASPQQLLVFADQVAIRLLAGHLAGLLTGQQIAQCERLVGDHRAARAQTMLRHANPAARELGQLVDWKRFGRTPVVAALGLQMILRQLEDRESGLRRRMRLRCEPVLIDASCWRGGRSEQAQQWLQTTWRSLGLQR